MALGNGIRFIWLDAHIGQDGECSGMKGMFCRALEPTAAVPPNEIDALIRALDGCTGPFLFVDTIAKALALVDQHRTKKIVFISSGSLGKDIIPQIIRDYPHVHSFYIFCAVIANHDELASKYGCCLQVLNNEIDLLVRLARDISEDIIGHGKCHLELFDPGNALKCFQCARALNIAANTIDKLNPPYLDLLKQLDDHDDRTGLIQRAMIMREQQQQQSNDAADEDEQLSQPESSAD